MEIRNCPTFNSENDIIKHVGFYIGLSRVYYGDYNLEYLIGISHLDGVTCDDNHSSGVIIPIGQVPHRKIIYNRIRTLDEIKRYNLSNLRITPAHARFYNTKSARK